jgi:hypothetical protein
MDKAARAALLTAKGMDKKFSSMDDLLAASRENIARKNKMTADLAAHGKPVMFTMANGRKAMAGPDMSKPEGFRLTYLDQEGAPTGHFEFPALHMAIRQALDEQFEPVGKSTGGAMEFARHVEAVNRAGGQIAPSKYLPNVPRAVHAGGGKVAYHATQEPFENYDWGRLGQTTKDNTSGTSVDDWASSLANLGPWSHEKPISKQLGMKTDLPVMLTGKEKKFKSLDHLSQEISRHGGPAALREKLVSQGYGHVSVDDEEFGGKSYVGLSPDHFKITKAESGEVEGKRDFTRDNPGGDWLESKQARAAQHPDMKFMTGSTTGVIGGRSDVFLPTHILKGIAGLNDEVRTAGVHKYDSLLAGAQKGGFDSDQEGNKVVVAVNHYGQPYLLEGNTRVAVAHAMGVPKVKAEVRYWNGAEDVDGPMHPEKVFGMASDSPDITKAGGGRIGYDNGGVTPDDQGSRTGFPELDRIITGVGNLNKMFNPVEAAGQSMEASKRMFAPDTSGWGRVAATGDMLTGMAGTALPFASVARPAAATAKEVRPLVEGFDAYQGSPHNFPAERLVRMPDGSTQHIVGAPDALPDIPAGAQVLQDYPLGRMRMDKIGTGEGNQSYGYGLYGAEAEDVARTYRDTLSQNSKFTPYVTYKAEEFLKNAGGDYQKAADAAKQQLIGNLDSQQAHEIGEVARLLDAKSVSNGRMYHIRVKADPNDFINYDAPFHEQPKNVQEFFSHMAADQPHGQVLAKGIQTPEHAANAAKAGIPGVKFLDQGSRVEGAGTRNYVMFDDKPISILRKYEYGGRITKAVGGDVDGDDDDGITAYHGSAYDFPQFDINKLGTGTGHQAYGHGLYFAGNENDAKNYREMLKNNGSIDIEHESHKLGIPLDRDAQADLRSVSRNVNGDPTAAARALQARNLAARAMPQEKLADLIDRHRKSTTGHMYKVKLNVKPEELLDWNKPLSEQHPNVQAALSRTMPDYTIKNMAGMPHAFANGKMIEINPNGLTGRDAYVLSRMGKSTESSNSHQDAKAASEHLLSEGIKGIRYKEGGTHNYVMFHHDPVQLVNKYEYGGAIPKARDVSAALALTRRFTKDGIGATVALKSKGK